MVGRGLIGLVATLLLLGAAGAAEWGGLTPGVTTRREVEARYGRPTQERTVTEEGRSAAEWTYSGERAPRGLDRMVIAFGLIVPKGFDPQLVRAVTLHPKPRMFSVEAIVVGWGKPEAFGTEPQTGRTTLHYPALGLLVIMDRPGQWAEVMLFAPPQPK